MALPGLFTPTLPDLGQPFLQLFDQFFIVVGVFDKLRIRNVDVALYRLHSAQHYNPAL
jgi:hypothetical protein